MLDALAHFSTFEVRRRFCSQSMYFNLFLEHIEGDGPGCQGDRVGKADTTRHRPLICGHSDYGRLNRKTGLHDPPCDINTGADDFFGQPGGIAKQIEVHALTAESAADLESGEMGKRVEHLETG